MDKKKLKRHDLVYPSIEARNRLRAEHLVGLTGERAFLVAAVFAAASPIPGIVRREEALAADELPLGFVHPQLINGSRIRVAAVLKEGEAVKLQRPYELARLDFAASTACMEAAQAACVYAVANSIKLGVLGSAGLEIATGLPFTHTDSDLDLLITGVGLTQLQKAYVELQAIGQRFRVAIDLEVELGNGYGIKAAELFQPTRTVLGKSLTDVQLLKKEAVLEILPQEA